MTFLRNIFLILLVLVASGCGKAEAPVVVPEALTPTTTAVTPGAPTSTKPVPTPVPTPKPTPTPTPVTVPATVDIKVGFASQAPFGVWDELHGEACEEASVAMVAKHYLGEAMTPHVMEQAILKLVDWENAQGIPIDANAEETSRMLEANYGLRSTLVTEVTANRIKQELANGNLIIIPAAGRLLGNPNFTGAGPVYHMLVIRGYTATEFITNDPGTRLGNGYRYSYNTIINAIHDWSHALGDDGMTDEEMAKGRKVMIVVAKP